MQENNYGSDVNIWLVSDLGLIITSDQHCQFLCRMSYNLQKFPNSSKLDQEAGWQGGKSDFILQNVLCICVLKISSSDKNIDMEQ